MTVNVQNYWANKLHYHFCLCQFTMITAIENGSQKGFQYLKNAKSPPPILVLSRWTSFTCNVDNTLDPIYTGLVTTVHVLYLLEICCLG